LEYESRASTFEARDSAAFYNFDSWKKSVLKPIAIGPQIPYNTDIRWNIHNDLPASQPGSFLF
jgi:hypothetical protein